MTTLHKLSARTIKTLSKGKYGDGAGLWLSKSDLDGGKWFLRYTIHGQRREMGLGSFRDVSLKEARQQASHWREVVRLGKDPIRERERLKREAAKPVMTLEMVAREAFEAKKTGLKADGKAGRWMSPIELHVLPKFGRIPIGEIDQTDVKRILSPIWRTKSDTARKVVSRLRYIIKYAAASKLEVDIQAVDLAVILLGETGHVSKNIPAMNWKDVPKFYQGLEDRTVSHIAVRFLILTGVRAKPVRHGLCCTNRGLSVLPLSPDGFILRAL